VFLLGFVLDHGLQPHAPMVLTIVAAALLILALAQLLLAWRVRANVPALSSLPAPARSANWPRLSVIVPACDESFGIEGALASKLSCGYPNLEVVVVDDRSTDDTGALARGVSRQDPRVCVTRIDELPPGWLGKLHAMSAGAARATGEWILLSDADVHIEPGALERVIAHAEAEGIDFVALMPQADPVDAILDACLAAVARFVSLGFRLWAANDDRSSAAMGVGAFNLVRKRALDASPGLAHLRMEVADDVALGAMLKASGARCRVFAARRYVHLVCAERLDVLARNLEKGGHVFGFSLSLAILVPFAFLAIELGVPALAIAQGGVAAALAAGQLAALTIVNVVVARHFAAPLRGAILWPIGMIVMMALAARAGMLGWWRGGIVWRGTRYSRSEIEAGRRFIGGCVEPTRETAGR
ncbi:MAG TPA: glycosyltransferase family 2 protein, partial [Polyangiaceae bacterium]